MNTQNVSKKVLRLVERSLKKPVERAESPFCLGIFYQPPKPKDN